MLKQLYIVDDLAVRTYEEAKDFCDERYKYLVQKAIENNETFFYPSYIKPVYILESEHDDD